MTICWRLSYLVAECLMIHCFLFLRLQVMESFQGVMKPDALVISVVAGATMDGKATHRLH